MRIQLKRSSTLLEDGSAKPPSSTQMEYGELAVNFNSADPAIFFKDTDSTIVRIGGAGSIGQGTATIDLDAGPGLYITNPEFTLDQTDDQTIAVGIQLDTDDEVVGLEFAADRLRAKKATSTTLGTIKEPEGLGVYMRQVTGSGEQWVLKDASVALPDGYPDLSDGDGSTLDDRYIQKKINQTYTGTRLTISQNLTVGNDLDANKINATGTITGNVTGDLTGNADTATFAQDAQDSQTAVDSTNCSRSVFGGNGLTGGGRLNANRTLAVGASDATIIVDADGIRVDQSNLNFTDAAKDGQININATNGLVASGNNATANQGGNTTRTISGVNATTSAKGVVQLNNTVTSTSTTQAATANAAKEAYDRAEEYAPSKTGANASGTWGIDISGNAATADVAASVTGNIDSATRADTADTLKVRTTTTDVNRPFVFIGNSDNAGGTYEEFYRDTATTCYINPNTNTIGATNFTSTNVTASNKVTTSWITTSRIASDGNLTIQPNGTTEASSVLIYPGLDDDGVGGNIVIGKGATDGSGGHIYFRGGGGADQFRFAKSGQTAIEGYLSFESLTADRTFTYPDATGTIALTSSTVDNATYADNADKVDNLHASSFLRSDAADSWTGSLSSSAGSLTVSNVDAITDVTRIKFGRSSTQYMGFYGDSNGNTLVSVSSAGNVKDSVRFQTSIDGGASVNKTWSLDGNNGTIWHTGNDGSGSGLDADKLDGLQATSFLRSDANDTATGDLTLNGTVNIRGALDISDDKKVNFGSSDDWTCRYDSNNWMYINQKGNGIIFQDSGTNKFRLEDTGVFYPETTNTGTIGKSDRYWDRGYFQDLDVSSTLNVRGAIDLADNDILRFGTGDDAEFFCNGSHMYLDLNSGIGNFYIRDGSATRYTFDDNGTLTCSAVNATLNNEDVRLANAGSSYGKVGTYALLRVNNGNNYTKGETIAGSNTQYSNAAGNTNSSPPGNWRCMGRVTQETTPGRVTVWLRYN